MDSKKRNDDDNEDKVYVDDIDINDIATPGRVTLEGFGRNQIEKEFHLYALARFTARIEAIDIEGVRFIIPHHWVFHPNGIIEGLELDFDAPHVPKEHTWYKLQFLHESENVLAECEIFDTI